MRFVKSFRRPISLTVIISFAILLIFWANQGSVAAAAPSADKSSTAAVDESEGEGPGFIEAEESPPQAKKAKKFPWLIVGAAVVIGAAAVYFLVLKKSKYTLNVSLTGATGTPAATAKYKKGTVVNYNYSASSGFANLEVRLDGAAVAAAGTVTMNSDHSLTVTAVQGSVIQVNSNPAGAKIFMDNADSGFTTPHGFSYPAAVSKKILVRACGYRDYGQTVSAALGQTVTVDANLAPGIREDFDAPATCWLPKNAGSWSCVGGVYRYSSAAFFRVYNFYDHAFSGDFAVKVRMRRVSGESFANSLLFAKTDSTTSCSGYSFQWGYKKEAKKFGEWDVVKYIGWNMDEGGGNSEVIQNWTRSDLIHDNLGEWNEIRIVKSGSRYSYYINGGSVFSFTDATLDPHYIALLFYSGDPAAVMEYDYVDFTPIAGAD